MISPLFIIYYDLNFGGIQRKIVDIVNFIGKNKPDLPVYVFLLRKNKSALKKLIKNPSSKIIYCPCYFKIINKIIFPFYIFYKTLVLKPSSLLTFSFLPSFCAILIKILFFWRKTIVVISEEPNSILSNQIRYYNFWRIRNLIIKYFYPFADKIFTISKLFLDDLIRTYNFSPQKIDLFPNWTILTEAKTDTAKKKYDLVFVGRLSPQKNIEFLLEGILKIKNIKNDVTLCLVGDGEEREKLENFVKNHQLEKNVIFIGFSKNVASYLRKAKIFVLSSKTEGFPSVILEAMAMELPIISSDYPGVLEIIQKGKTGFVYSNLEEFANQTLKLLNDSSLREKMGSQGRKYVQKYHTPQNINLYFDALGLNKHKIKIGLICSRGGHLLQLHYLKDWWQKYDRFWVTGQGEDSKYLLKNERIYYGYFPEHHNLVNAFKNLILAFKIIKKEKPDLLFSTGAGIAPPFFLIGKVMRCKLIFLDSYTFVEYLSLSAKLTSCIVDELIVQHQRVTRLSDKAKYWGSVI